MFNGRAGELLTALFGISRMGAVSIFESDHVATYLKQTKHHLAW